VFSIVINALAVGLGIALFSQVGVQDKVGMFGLSYTIAYWVVLGLSFWWLTRTVKQIEISSLGTLFAKVIFASFSAAGIMQWVMSTWSEIFTGNSRTVFLALVVLWALCICVYFALASLLQVKEIEDVSQIVRKRFTRSDS
jgi:peptidoglycan biosynthesis protein MviN/MurJ (putative lipid II flippase)